MRRRMGSRIVMGEGIVDDDDDHDHDDDHDDDDHDDDGHRQF